MSRQSESKKRAYCTEITRRAVLGSAAAAGIAGLSGFGAAEGRRNSSGLSVQADDEDETEEDENDGEAVGEATFAERTVEAEQGRIATVTVLLDDAEEARVRFGSEAVNYEVRFTVSDGTGDDEVAVAIDTYRAGLDPETAIEAIEEDDELTEIETEIGPVEQPLEAAAYDLRLFVDGEESDLAVLELAEWSIGSLHSGVAPEAEHPDDEFVDSIVPRSAVAQGDWAVAGVLGGALENLLEDGTELDAAAEADDENDDAEDDTDEEDDENGENDEDGGDDADVDEAELAEHGISLTVSEREEDVMNRDPEEIPANELRLLSDPEWNGIFVVYDTTDLEAERIYETELTVTEEFVYLDAGEEESSSTTHEIVERTATPDDEEPITLPPEADATVSGTTTVAPGTEFVVELRSEEAPFLLAESADIDDDGEWTVTFDLSDVEDETPFTMEVRGITDPIDGIVGDDEEAETEDEEADDEDDGMADEDEDEADIDEIDDEEDDDGNENDGDEDGSDDEDD